MPAAKVNIQCRKKHPLFFAYYRNTMILKRIGKLYYCPKCNEFYEASSNLIEVKIRR